MNKVFNINLGGIVFTIDDVAFDKLNKYINKLKAHFGNTQGATDIIADIEARMAELLQQKLASATDIVNEQMVDEVIAIMGDVNELDEEGRTEQSYQRTSANETDAERKLRRDMSNKVIGGVCSGIGNYFGIDATIIRIGFLIAFFVFGTGALLYAILWAIIQPNDGKDTSAASREYAKKRLFRDTDDKVISGVCSGIAHYIGVDAVWIRIVFAVAFFVFGVGFWVYIALWLAVPKAITAAQKLQMKGDPIDISNIEREVKNAFNNAKQNAPRVGKEIRDMGNTLAEGASGLVVVIGKLFGVVLLFLAIIGISLLGMAFVGVGKAAWIKEIMVMVIDNNDSILLVKYGILLLIGVPLLSFVITAFRIIFNLKFKKGPIYTILGILTFIGGVMLAYSVIEYMGSISEKANYTERIAVEKHDTLYLVTTSKEFDGNKISIGNGGINECTLKINDNGLLQCSQELIIKKSFSDSTYIDIKKTSRGALKSDALTFAQSLQYSVVTNGSHIAFDEGIFVPKESKWKHPNVKATLRVPVGTIIIADEEIVDMLNRNEDNEEYYDGKTFIMTDKGIKCLDCEGEINWKDKNIEINIEGDDDNGGENVNIDLSLNENDSTPDDIHIITKKKNVIINGQKTEVKEKQVGPLHIKIEKSKSIDTEKNK